MAVQHGGRGAAPSDFQFVDFVSGNTPMNEYTLQFLPIYPPKSFMLDFLNSVRSRHYDFRSNVKKVAQENWSLSEILLMRGTCNSKSLFHMSG